MRKMKISQDLREFALTRRENATDGGFSRGRKCIFGLTSSEVASPVSRLWAGGVSLPPPWVPSAILGEDEGLG